MYNNISRLFFIFSFIVLASAVNAEQYSGFLDDYSILIANPERNGAFKYVKSGIALEKYNKVIIFPIEIWYADESEYKGFSPDEFKLIGDTFRNRMIDLFEPGIPVVDSVGDDVLTIQIAITNLKMKKKRYKFNDDSYNFIGFTLYTLKEIINKNVILDDVDVEAKVYDSKSGELLGEILDRYQRSDTDRKLDKREVEELLEYYAMGFINNLKLSKR
jgi:Protein of unknown function (DUF3313)